MAFRMGNSSTKCSGSSKNCLATGNKFSVLVVDDDPVVQRIHRVFLNRFGFETQVVGNGKEAVDLYCSGASFHLVLMDMEMPVMDGPKVSS
ncbi:response regulator, partial [Lactiplantibacillus plantarum]|uniref:response regulator n=1 Tax=Lactiplantibacillus plantarum TaxID=1590 RepID=UPI001FCD1FD7